MTYTIKVNIAGFWNRYNFENKSDAMDFIGYLQDAVKKSATDPSAGFSAGDNDEMSTIYGRHVVGFTVVRPEEN